MKPLLLLLALVSPAHAENWVDTKLNVHVDVDSIQQGKKDSTVYYLERRLGDAEGDSRTAAVDCGKSIVFDSDLMFRDPQWRTKGVGSHKPGSSGQRLLDFICSRLPAPPPPKAKKPKKS